MKWVVTKNNKPLEIKNIPELSIRDFRQDIIALAKQKMRVVSFFGLRKDNAVTIYCVMADDETSRLFVASSKLNLNTTYDSISQSVPAFSMFEREFYEEFGILPENHPWLKPVRYSAGRFDKSAKIEEYPFFTMDGEEIHQVAVGPVHAGIIEPGHFRFMCCGENICHLEIQLGYQHRDIESLILKRNDFNKKKFNMHLAESIAGDTSIGHALAYADVIEALSNCVVSRRAESIRAIALELERIGIHIGDLGAISNDIGYLMGNAVFGATRTLAINSMLAICGSRFGRGLIKVGGVAFDIDTELMKSLSKTFRKIDHDVTLMGETMLSQATVLSRLETTGIVDKHTASEIGMAGLSARASGYSIDVRADHPFGIYKYYPIYKTSIDNGDVFARTYLRYVEIGNSIKFIFEQFDNLPENNTPLLNATGEFAGDSFVVSLVEGWRGEIAHCAITDADGNLIRYKIKDPSFNNWFALALAVRNNGISDFPLCNKSFNLSYCGFDL